MYDLKVGGWSVEVEVVWGEQIIVFYEKNDAMKKIVRVAAVYYDKRKIVGMLVYCKGVYRYWREDCCVLRLFQKWVENRKERMVGVRDGFDSSMIEHCVGCMVEVWGWLKCTGMQ